MTKKLLVSFGLYSIIAGCCAMSCSHLKKGDATASNMRLFWASEGFEFEAATNGAVKIKLQKSNPDAESLKAVAQGAAQGVAQGMKP